MFIQNLRQFLRQLEREPVFALVAIASIALGIGATTMVLSVIHAVVLHPFPYTGADRMVNVRLYDRSGDRGGVLLSGMQFLQLQKADLLDGAVAMDNWEMATTNDFTTEGIRAAHLSANAFAYFGVAPLLGRTITEADAAVAVEPNHVVVLSYKYWQAHFGASKDVLGRVLKLDKENYTIVGVMPRRFTWAGSDVYLLLKISQDPERTNVIYLRLKPGVSLAKANAQLQSLMEQFAHELPDHFPREFGVRLVGMIDGAVGEFSGHLLLLLAAVSLLLLIGCTNVSILLLARGIARQHELATRFALGASQKHILFHVVSESVTLAMAGAAAGIAIAFGTLPIVMHFLPADLLPSEVDIRINLPILLFTLLVAAGSGIFASIIPALRLSQTDVSSALHAGTQRSIGSARSKNVFSVLIASQIAITVLLLTGAGASLAALVLLLRAPLGYDPHNVVRLWIPLADGSFTKWGERVAYFDEIRRRVGLSPSTESVAYAAFELPPLSEYRSAFRLSGRASDEGDYAVLQQVSPEFFRTLRIPLLEGRIWTESENLRPAHVAVINHIMAMRFWPGTSPVGQTITVTKLKAYTTWMLDSVGNDGSVEIIGVVGDVPNDGLRSAVLPTIYAPYPLVATDGVQLLVRARANTAGMLQLVSEQIHAVNPVQAVSEYQTLEDMLSDAGWGRERFMVSLFIPLAVVATMLSAIGLFSVISYTISQRTREIGIRMALGAGTSQILFTVLIPVAMAVAFGLASGIVLCFATGRAIAHWTEVSVNNALVLGGSASLVILVGWCSTFVPAFRAASLHPMDALRKE